MGWRDRCTWCGSVFLDHWCGGYGAQWDLLTATARNEMIARDRQEDPGYAPRPESDWRTQTVMNIPVRSPYKDSAGTDTAPSDESGEVHG